MATEKFEVKIESILGGQSRDLYNGSPDQFHISIGIDPDIQLINTNANKTSGAIVPSSYAEFSSTVLTGDPMWAISSPKDTNLYVVTDDDELISYSSSLGSEAEIGNGYADTSESGNGNGAAYYNNYIYMATTIDVARYGPLDGTAAITKSYWSGTLSLGALTNTTYTNLRGVFIPNHPMHVHSDNKLYFGDITGGQGVIHYFQTSKTTDEGDTNNGSTFNALDLPFGYRPVDIESWGTDLAVLAVEGLNANVIQGKSSLFLWDTVADSFYLKADIQDPFATALLNHNGHLYIWSGASRGCRVSVYEGGYSARTLGIVQEGAPPFAGAVAAIGERIMWGSYTDYPFDSASVFAMGYKDKFDTAIHNIINTDSVENNTQVVTCLRHFEQASGSDSSLDDPLLIVGWGDNTGANGFGLDKKSNNSANAAEIRFLYYKVGRPFRIDEVVIPLGEAITTNHTLVVTVYYDDGSTTEALTTINSTNFTASERRVRLRPADTNRGNDNFTIGLKWTGTRQLAVTLPIIIKGTTFDEDGIE